MLCADPRRRATDAAQPAAHVRGSLPRDTGSPAAGWSPFDFQREVWAAYLARARAG